VVIRSGGVGSELLDEMVVAAEMVEVVVEE